MTEPKFQPGDKVEYIHSVEGTGGPHLNGSFGTIRYVVRGRRNIFNDRLYVWDVEGGPYLKERPQGCTCETHLRHYFKEIPYDPNQQGDTEDDI